MTENKQLEVALEVYPEATPETKIALQRIFGRKAFPKSQNIEDLDFDDILEIAKPSAEVMAIINYTGDDEDMIGLRGLAALTQICKVYNEGQVIDYTNGKYKYFVWVDMSTASGAGFSISHYVYRSSYSLCGSRLTFINEQRALLAIKKFPQYYMDLFNIRNQIPYVELRILKAA